MADDDKNYIEITTSILNLQKMYDFVLSESAGAVDLFVGTVRNTFEGRNVRSIEYHGYPEMAEHVLQQIIDRTRAQWLLEKIAIQHRVGHLQLEEASVLIAVSAPHRHEAFSACRYIMEEIKLHLPIWKKEFFADGSVEWQRT